MKIHVPKIACQGCANRIINHLKCLDGVKEVTVDLQNKTVSITTSLDQMAITQELTAIGYPPENIKELN